jgi:hypothetical protein
MAADTHANDNVAEYSNKHFVNVYLHNKKQAEDMARFRGKFRGFPTTFLLEPGGEIIGKFVGYRAPDAYLKGFEPYQAKMADYSNAMAALATDAADGAALVRLSGVYKTWGLIDKYRTTMLKAGESNPDSVEIQVVYAEVLMETAVGKVADVLDNAAKLDPENTKGMADDIAFLRLRLKAIANSTAVDDNAKAFETFLADNPESNRAADAWFELGIQRYGNKDWLGLEEAMNKASELGGDSETAKLARQTLKRFEKPIAEAKGGAEEGSDE